MNQAKMVQMLGFLAEWALKFRLPVRGIIRATVFQEFCGGESLQKSLPKIAELQRSGIGSIPDYSVEGLNSEKLMDETLAELLDALTFTANHPETPLFVFKVTGLVHSDLLEASAKSALTDPKQIEAFHRGKGRVMNLLRKASDMQCPIMIDAEESWLQDPIDQIAMEASVEFNRSKAIVIQTLQLYRHDRLEYLDQCLKHAQEEGYVPGFKVVRGAYMEKERERAALLGYLDPIQTDKETTDRDTHRAIEILLQHPNAFFCLGTHNRSTCVWATELMERFGLAKISERVLFAQLLGMSDSLSAELADEGYRVAKYLPYGPVDKVLPYLLRRARENSSAAGELSREYALLLAERRQRRQEAG
ncbi:MAG: proline dehydrogenase family protein [Bacteroidota bacterium]